MRRIVSLMCISVLLGFSVFQEAQAAQARRTYPSRPTLDKTYPSQVGRYWSMFAVDTALTNAMKLVTNGTFTQLTRSDTLRIRSSSTADSSLVIIYGTSRPGNSLQEEKLELSGNDTVYATNMYRWFTIASLDTASAGTVTVYGKRVGAIATILPNRLSTEAAHYYTGALEGGITHWSVSADTTTHAIPTIAFIRAELRLYPSALSDTITDAAQNHAATGYHVIDRVTLNVGGLATVVPDGRRAYSRSFVKDFGAPFLIPAKGHVGVYAASATGTITTGIRLHAEITGYDKGPK